MALEDIDIIAQFDSPATLAIELAKSASRKKDPVYSVLVVELLESGEIVPYWSEMDVSELSMILVSVTAEIQAIVNPIPEDWLEDWTEECTTHT